MCYNMLKYGNQKAGVVANVEKQRENGRRLYQIFTEITVEELERMLIEAETREERAVYREMINLKLQLEQEQVTGEVLL